MKPEPKLSKKEYDKQRYIKKRDIILKHGAEYRKNNRQLLKDKSKEYYKHNVEQIKKRTYEDKRNNNWYYNEHTKKYSKDWHRKEENKVKDSVRGKTRYDYGKLPKGYQYHHPKPYDKDVWVGVPVEEHTKWENH